LSNPKSSRLEAVTDKTQQILRRARLHAGWDFFGKQLKKELGHGGSLCSLVLKHRSRA